jgi:hypothetical protein
MLGTGRISAGAKLHGRMLLLIGCPFFMMGSPIKRARADVMLSPIMRHRMMNRGSMLNTRVLALDRVGYAALRREANHSVRLSLTRDRERSEDDGEC